MHLSQTLPRRLAAGLLAAALALCTAGCAGQAGQSEPASQPASTPASEPAPADSTPAATPAPETVGADPYALNVEAVDGLGEDFIMGVDISSLPAELQSGVVYHDLDGNPITNIAGFCRLMAECGVTHVRVRVWNDPYDADHNGYGGGNNDVVAAAALAEGCKEAGLHMLVDFHLSDFWADPNKQMEPKAWAGYTLDEKCDAAAAYLTEALTAIEEVAPGVVDMVQIGNETTNGVAGIFARPDMCKLFSAGCAAVKAFGEEQGRGVKRVIHVTNPEKGTVTDWAETLDEQGVDYDVLATSYYPYWHGSLENLTAELTTVQDEFGKEAMVAETSYANTLVDTDGSGNTVAEGSNDTGMDLHWSFTTQGQAVFLRDLIDAVNTAGGIGVFYWEPAWITVGDITAGASKANNQKLWEEFGSGWASSYAAAYDPEDAGKYYGGSAVDNQAFFDAAGQPLASIKVWQYAREGCENPGLPPEEWLEGTGTPAETGAGPVAVEGNLLPATVASFDDGGGFVIGGSGISGIPNSEDPYEGENDMHWWSESAAVTGTVTTAEAVTLAPGAYTCSLMAQGFAGDTVKLQLVDAASGEVLAENEPTALTGWADWHTLTLDYTAEAEVQVQVCVTVDMQASGWGTCDLLTLCPAA